ncbi:MAG: arsenate reductase (glutaredoxin) [Cytophagales bacterium CG12_big_fil_rev_8_21_14_0_65_40_12]|nr:MAG: arsenate reductase (glutaredoxin) [Cytophagales bacterium CG12_big_fil_rev_8_21_14_0_65_40_12]PIW04973.1 MAG: arsenate reductase (glutaredoxin) [Cytophagales bacterium CG17_big_fil_post_rev_8_21_14_2_50_40_13]
MLKIYHNPRCQKSRQTLQLIQESGAEYAIVEYLNNIPTKDELKSLLKKLGMPAESLVRKSEQLFKDEFKGKDFSETEWIQIMVEHPKLIERPIVVKGDKAVLGRPPENVTRFL